MDIAPPIKIPGLDAFNGEILQMVIDPKAFELQMSRVFNLLKDTDSIVEWNDHIEDPENPQQQRQIDISIRKGGTLTIVECRARNTPQDVTWVEALIGRKLSLRANGVIAVSSSGFTNGAVRKAEKYEVILRDLVSVTDEEVKSWGSTATISHTFLRFEDLNVQFKFSDGRKYFDFPIRDVYWEAQSKGIFPFVFQELRNGLNLGQINSPRRVSAELDGRGVGYSCGHLNSITVSAIVEKTIRKVDCPGCILFGSPQEKLNHRKALVQRFSLGDTEIIKSDEQASIILDYSNLSIPDNSIYCHTDIDMGIALPLKIEKIIKMNNIMGKFENVQFGVHLESARIQGR